MKTYAVRAERDGKRWVLSVPEVPGALSQVRRLSQASEEISDAIALVLEVPEDSFAVTVEPVLPDDELAQLRALRAKQREADRLQREAAAESRALVSRLHDDGLTVRDIGTVLGTSPQRAQQLLQG